MSCSVNRLTIPYSSLKNQVLLGYRIQTNISVKSDNEEVCGKKLLFQQFLVTLFRTRLYSPLKTMMYFVF